jgi:aspartyl aminopeptidase
MKKKTEKLKNKLVRKKKSAWDYYTKREKNTVFKFGDNYRTFLSQVKTEREAVEWIVKNASKKGFKKFTNKNAKKFYMVNRNKSVALAVIGKKPASEGIRIVISHIDSPRLDLKPNPISEEEEISFLRTHYYGGIKKYQWTSIPLSLHGIIIDGNGKKIKINIGDNPQDPVFTVADLLPHLSHKEQDKKTIQEAIEGEKLTLVAGSIPFPDKDEKKRVKLAVIEILNKMYGIKEEDFISAEIEAVPAMAARDIGWDRSMIGGYGHDDRTCAYTSFHAVVEIKTPNYSSLVLFVDKEETGSVGTTGAQSEFFIDAVREIISRKKKNPNYALTRTTLNHSKALSGDVTAAINPNYKNVLEKTNACKLGYGVSLTKYTGSKGKYGTNDASAEFIGEIRNLFNKKNVIWQTGELGKVDEGGGGTVSQFIAKQGVETLDCGPPVLAMHSPFEVCSKSDLYETYKAYKAFLES